MDCCNYPEYRSGPYYYWGGYPPYWGGGGGGGVGYPGPGYPSPQPYAPPAPPSYHPTPHVLHTRDSLDYRQAHSHTMPTEYGYASKERFRRLRERPNELYRGSLEWAEYSYMPTMSDSLRDTPWSYSWNQNNNCNGWQSSARGGYPLRPVALQGGYPPPSSLPLPPHRDPLRGMAAMQATSIAHDKNSLCSWESYHGREVEDERIATPQAATQPATQSQCSSPAPKPHRSPRSRDESTPVKERARKNKSPKNTVSEDIPVSQAQVTEMLTKPKPDAVPLPAFKQAFGSTEIGRFSEVFTSPGAITEDMVSKAISQGLLGEWKDTENWVEVNDEPPWVTRNKEIKCEDSF